MPYLFDDDHPRVVLARGRDLADRASRAVRALQSTRSLIRGSRDTSASIRASGAIASEAHATVGELLDLLDRFVDRPRPRMCELDGCGVFLASPERIGRHLAWLSTDGPLAEGEALAGDIGRNIEAATRRLDPGQAFDRGKYEDALLAAHASARTLFDIVESYAPDGTPPRTGEADHVTRARVLEGREPGRRRVDDELLANPKRYGLRSHVTGC